MAYYVSERDSITKEKFNSLWKKLKREFPGIWEQADSVSDWNTGEETLCTSISPCIGRWFDDHGVKVAMMWGSREWTDVIKVIDYEGLDYRHMFNIIYIDGEEYIIDGSFKQFDVHSSRLRLLHSNSLEFKSYIRSIQWAHESMLDLISWSNTVSGESYQNLPKRILMDAKKLYELGADNWEIRSAEVLVA
jgi:hypothetical protein